MADETAPQLEAKIAALRASIDSGVLSVDYPGAGRTQFRDLGEMKEILIGLQGRLNYVNGNVRVRTSRVVVTTRTGF